MDAISHFFFHLDASPGSLRISRESPFERLATCVASVASSIRGTESHHACVCLQPSASGVILVGFGPVRRTFGLY
jgi:3-methyladenine DNA glycosylase/8-oxoguanine DNA glycosylase